MGFSREQLEAARDRTVPDLVGPDLRLLFIGINPGLWTAAAGAHFAHPGNRFYKALHAAGIILPESLDVSEGFTEVAVAALLDRGLGITNLVDRATARADELTTDELREGARRLVEKVGRWRPKVAAVVGITAYRTAFGRGDAAVGRQEEDLAGAELWALPNPSGLNAHYRLIDLARLYREAAAAAGVELGPMRR
ncbi:MAG: G/U mismatch-specific DNA glycosylase [Nitriliruptorales bacterium]